MITLQELRKSRYEDMFLAVLVEEVDWENAGDIRICIDGFPEVKTLLDLLRVSVESALEEKGIPLTDENRKKEEQNVKETITTHVEKAYGMILLKQGEIYIDLSEMEKLDERYKIKILVPFSQYYNEDDYSFEEDKDGNPQLLIETEPFDCFEKDYLMK